MLKNLNDCKQDWWNYNVKTLKSQRDKIQQIINQRFDKNDQYDIKTSSLNFQRRFNFYFVNQSYKLNVY